MADSSLQADKSEVRVVMWTIPRTVSTALTKCLNSIDGIVIWLEPFGYSYAASGAIGATQQEIPTEYEGNEEVFAKAAEVLAAFTNATIIPDRLPYSCVKKSIENTTGKYVFVKDHAQAMTSQFRKFLPTGFKHTFLIREPSRIFVSYRRAMYKQLSEMGALPGKSVEEFDIEADDVLRLEPGSYFKRLYELWKHVRENIDPDPIVIDATDLLSNPGETLRAYLEAVGLPYSDKLLTWPASVDELRSWKTVGERIVDSLYSFYHTAMTSSHFMPPSDVVPREQLTSDVIRCIDDAIPYYREMYESRVNR